MHGVRARKAGSRRAATLALLVVIAGLAPGCASAPRARTVDTLTGEAMGTTWTVKLVSAADTPPRPALQAGIQAELDRVDAQMSTWREDSDLARFNAAPAGQWVSLPPEMFAVLTQALALARDTGGAYDPTVGPLVTLWGFGPGPKTRTTPAPAALAAARARVGWQRVTLDAAARRARQPGGVALDLSSIAPGYAVDEITRYLDRAGVQDFLVEHGGELRGRGNRPGGHGWRVGIEQPDSEDLMARVVVLADRASGSSGDYRKFYTLDGQRYSHHIDPRTGAPVTHALASVTVLADEGLQADSLAAALSILGPEQGLQYAREHHVAALFLVRAGSGFTQTMTPEFAAAQP